MLLSETHLTEKYNFQIPGYKFYFTNHPDGKAHGGTVILIRLRIKHHFLGNWREDCLQCTSINLQCHNGALTLAAVYCPPRFTISEEKFTTLFDSFGERFVAAGDWNAKHMYWGSRIVNPKGKQLYNAIIKPQHKLNYVSPGAPTYWPADPMKLPDFIDFAITKRIPQSMISAEALPELSSDQCPVLFHLLYQLQHIERPCRLTSNRTNIFVPIPAFLAY